MSYFIPSFIQKRLLRYTLSHLGILDTDALSLDNLDITWGKKSTVELKQIGIHHDKVASLLQLPDICTLSEAKIERLRLTVPADLHYSGIFIELVGLNLQVDVSLLDPPGSHVEEESKPQKSKPRDPESRNVVASGFKEFEVYGPDGSQVPSNVSEHAKDTGSTVNSVPDIHELANSFLQAESSQEKRVLHDAMLKSQSLDRLISSDASLENTHELGVGEDPSLPAFLADFLNGIVERAELSVHDIRVDSVLHFNHSDAHVGQRQEPAQAETLSLRLEIEQAHVGRKQKHPTAGSDGSRNFDSQRSAWARRIHISNLRIIIFHSLPMLSRLVESPSNLSSELSSSENSHPDRQAMVSNAELGFEEVNTIAATPNLAQSSQPLLPTSLHVQPSVVAPKNLDLEDDRTAQESSLLLESDVNRETETPTPEQDYPLDNASQMHRDVLQSRSTGISTREPAIERQFLSEQDTRDVAPAGDNRFRSLSLSGSQPRLELAHDFNTEDLTQSRLYSHDEAVSMYASAFEPEGTALSDDEFAMPGAWESRAPSEIESRVPEAFDSAIAEDDSSRSSPTASRLGQPVSSDVHAQRSTHHDDSGTPPIVPEALSPISSVLLGEKSTKAHTHTNADSHQQSAKTSQNATNSSGEVLIAKTLFELADTTISLNLGIAESSLGGAPPALKESHVTAAANRPQGSLHSVRGTLALRAERMNVYGDMSTTKLLLLALQKAKIYSSHADDGERKKLSSQNHSLYLDIKHVSWSFFTSIKEAEPRGKFLDLASEAKHRQSVDSSAILRAESSNVIASYTSGPTTTVSKITIRALMISDAVGAIVSLKNGRRMRSALRDAQAAFDSDAISVTIEKNTLGSGVLATNISTQPVNVVLNLQRLDDIIGCFGGLSSVLEIGNSMASTVTPVEETPQIPSVTKRRMVHFDPREKSYSPQETTTPTSNKINVRLGGLSLQIQGRKAAVNLETTAVKVIRRADIIAIQFDQIEVKGPASKDFKEEDIPSAILRNVRVEYHRVPQAEHLLQLIDLVVPSKLQAEDQFSDSLIVETLMHQRKKGGHVRLTIEHIAVTVVDVTCFRHATSFIDDLKKLSTVANYLPEDDRPGLLISSLVKTIELKVQVSERFGVARVNIGDWQSAFVTFPLLFALGVQTFSLHRNQDEEIIETSFSQSNLPQVGLPVFLARYIGNEMEPVIRVRLNKLRFEYQVSLLSALSDSDLAQLASSNADSVNRASSIATVTRGASCGTASDVPNSDPNNKPIRFPRADVVIKDSFVGLRSNADPSKAYIVINRSQISASMDDSNTLVTIVVDKASFLIIDKDNLSNDFSVSAPKDEEELLRQQGYVIVGNLLAPKIHSQTLKTDGGRSTSTTVNIDGGLLLLETCADSTQTLQKLLTKLTPQKPVSDDNRYRTETVPITDMLASFTGYAVSAQSAANNEDRSRSVGSGNVEDLDQGLINVEKFGFDGEAESDDSSDLLTRSMLEEDFGHPENFAVSNTFQTNAVDSGSNEVLVEQAYSQLAFHDEHFGDPETIKDPVAATSRSIDVISATIGMKNFHIIWNLFDGYDWHHTRDQICQAVTDVEKKAIERKSGARHPMAKEPLDASEDVIGDFLFNSIYIGIPAQADPADLTRQINQNINDDSSEVSNFTTSTQADALRSRDGSRTSKRKGVNLARSKHHKMTFELKGLACEAVFNDPRNETVASIDIKIQDLEIFDHLPTSTWKKFATYMKDAGERESDSHMVTIHVRNLRPVPDLAATEFSVKVAILPLRLHVDQDALDFLSRFFEFKDDQVQESSSETEIPFIQRAEVKPIRIKLDFKPKRVDYAGLRSGRTSEFMNFFVLDRAEMVLRHVILYGVSGFDRLGQTLNDIWSPDVKRNQLPGVLAGVGPIRSMVGVGEGVRDLFVVPIKEYQKDGRIVRSFQKGALAFAKTTTGELVRLGARLAIGTQTMLQGAEDFLIAADGKDSLGISEDWDRAELDQDEKEQISLYSNQPLGIMQGLRGGFANLERDLLTTKDVVIAMPGEIMESRSAAGAARAVMRRAPTIILRPAAGVSKAVGQTLLGATNSLDPANRTRVEDKYKRH